MRSKPRMRCLIGVVAAVLLSGLMRAGSPAADETRHGDGQTGVINLSHDLVRLGIGSGNLSPDSPTTDARPVSSDHVTISDATIHGSSAIAVLFISSNHSVADRVRVARGRASTTT